MLSLLKVPKGLTTDQMWEVLQVRKEKVQEWETVEDVKTIENILLRWSQLHHNKAVDLPFISEGEGQREKNNEPEYHEWLQVLMLREPELNCFDVDFATYKKYLLKMKENKRTSP